MERILCPDQLSADPSIPTSERDYKYWRQTFENFLENCKDKNPNKLQCLVRFVGPCIYEVIADQTDFDSAIRVLDNLYIKKRNAIFARHALATRGQEASESLGEFVQALHILSRNCQLKDVKAEEYRLELVRDAFITGISSSFIRQRLLEKQELTLDNAIEIAKSIDDAQRNTEKYSQRYDNTVAAATNQNERTDPESELMAVSKFNSKCWFCGKERHSRVNCPAKNTKCNKCGKMGHWSGVCKSRDSRSASKSVSATANMCMGLRGRSSNTRQSSLSRVTVPVKIGNYDLNALMDSASTCSFLDYDKAVELKLQINQAYGYVGLASSSKQVPIVGYCLIDIFVMDRIYKQMQVNILKNLCEELILGLDFLGKHKNIEFIFGGPEEGISIGNRIERCQLMKADLLETPLFENLSKNIRPIAAKSRIFGLKDLEFIRAEIARLLHEGVIEPSRSPWRSQIVVVKNEANPEKRRMCIDYSQTINLYTILDAYPLPNLHQMVTRIAQYKHFSTFDLKGAYHQIGIPFKERPYTAFEADGKLYQFTRIPFGVTNGVSAFQRAMDQLVLEENLKCTFPYMDNVTITGQNQAEHDENVKRFLEVVRRRNLTLNLDKSVESVESINLLGYNIKNNTISPDPERLKPLMELPIPRNAASLKRVMGLFSYYAKWIPSFSDKIRPLCSCNTFPMGRSEVEAFECLKQSLSKASLGAIDDHLPFTVETDASEVALSATLNQMGRPVAFMTRTLNQTEKCYPAVEKEAMSIIEAIRKWKYLLVGKTFQLITDQRSVAFMLDGRKRTKIKNNKILSWRLELADMSYVIKYRPGKENIAADTLSRACAMTFVTHLADIHDGLCHPGVTRLLHFVRSRNLPYSTNDVKAVCDKCRICAEEKPRYFRRDSNPVLIQAIKPMDRLSIDFKGPLPSSTSNKYLFTAVDEYSRYPFAIPCSDMKSETVIKCLRSIFALCGTCAYVHSDRGTSFMSNEVKDFLRTNGVATSRTTPYHPTGNSQVERYNGIIWKSICLALRSHNVDMSRWEVVLPNALQSIRTLLVRTTNSTPHERFFAFPRRSCFGSALPDWLSRPGPVLLRKFVRNKFDPQVRTVELVEANENYAHIKDDNGMETTVSTQDLARLPQDSTNICENSNIESHDNCLEKKQIVNENKQQVNEDEGKCDRETTITEESPNEPQSIPELRRSKRTRKPPQRYAK